MLMKRVPQLKVKAGRQATTGMGKESITVLDSGKICEAETKFIHITTAIDMAFTNEDYDYSSAKFYETGIDDFGILTHFRDTSKA